MENMLTPITSSDLIANSNDAIDAIKTAAGLTDTQFAALCMPVLRAYADHVQRLPLMAAAFASPRGAWEFGLTATMVAYRYAGTVIFFPTLGSEERRLLEPQCRYMAFLATLASAVATLAESSILVEGDDEYHPLNFDGTLHTWLADHKQARFTWRMPATLISAQAGAAIAANFIPKRLLANFDLRAVMMLYEAINPRTTMNGVESTLARVVREAVKGVLDHYKSKQAGTFQAEANAMAVSAVEAEKVASKLISIANPTILANPLETPAVAAPPAPGAGTKVLQKAAETDVQRSDLKPAQAPLALAPAAATAVAGAPPQPMTGSAIEAEEKLASAHKVLREWFSALNQHPQFHVLKDQLVMNDDGIEVPLSMLGMFGVTGGAVRKMLDDAGLLLGRTANARGVILHPGLRSRFIAD
jgi:hypothetical protein